MDTFEKVRGFLYNKPINESNIIVFKNVYALGDLLLIPKICGNYTEYHEHPYYRANINAYKNSILAIYEELRTDKTEYIPNLNKIQQGVEIYIQRNNLNKKMNDLLEFVKRDDVLCVHLRSGDFGYIEEEYKEIIKNLQNEYQYVIIMCGAHHHHQHDIIIQSVNSLFTPLNNSIRTADELSTKLPDSNLHRYNGNNNIYISIEDPDLHMAMFHSCKNLLLHKNGFTILAGLVFTGNKLYISQKIFNKNYDFSKEDGNNMWNEYIKPENHIFREIIYM